MDVVFDHTRLEIMHFTSTPVNVIGVFYQKEGILTAKNSLMLAYLLGDVLLLTECPCMTSVD